MLSARLQLCRLWSLSLAAGQRTCCHAAQSAVHDCTVHGPELQSVCAGAPGAPQSLADHLDMCMERIRKLESAIGAQQVRPD